MNASTTVGRGRRRARFPLLALSVSIAASLLMSTAANATYDSAGYVSGIFMISNGKVLFNQSGNRLGGLPACAAGYPSRWAFDSTTVAGQAKLALLLTAYALHKQIFVGGTSTCGDWGDTESVDVFYTVNDS